MKLITPQEFRAQKTLTELQEREILAAEKLAQEVNAFMPASALIDYSEYEGVTYFESAFAYLHSSPLYCIRQYKGKYYVVNRTKYPNVDRHDAKIATAHLKEPNYIGVFTAKKLQNWVDYHNARHEILTSLSSASANKEAEFVEKLVLLPVQWHSDKKSGLIVVNGIEYSFTIKDGYIYERIEIHRGVSNTLENFVKLSNNKFVSPKN